MKNIIDKNEINTLTKLVGNGDKEAFEVLYSKMYKILYNFLYRRSLNPDNIEDIVSSTFLIVIQKSKNKLIYKNCFSWILTIAKYQLYNFNRKFKKLTFDEDIIDRCSTRYDMNKISLRMEIDKLSKPAKQILYFVYYLKLPYKDISKILNISISTLKRRINDIIKYLQEKYEE